jgi:16S rRNA pseudouridine516 synthase
MDRLDKALGNLGIGTRKEVKTIIKSGSVKVNGAIETNSDRKISLEDILELDGEILNRQENYYFMMYKPVGCITATEDTRESTVMDYLSDRERRMYLFPVGRLDKDTEGLLLITSDGKLGHHLTSPRHHITKTYFARVQGKVSEQDQKAFQDGVVLDDGYKSKPAELDILISDEISEVRIRIQEGKFRQIRRMFESLGKLVIYLKREKMGTLELDPGLNPGEYRPLHPGELESLKKDMRQK